MGEKKLALDCKTLKKYGVVCLTSMFSVFGNLRKRFLKNIAAMKQMQNSLVIAQVAENSENIQEKLYDIQVEIQSCENIFLR